jgi:hypothetical protein
LAIIQEQTTINPTSTVGAAEYEQLPGFLSTHFVACAIRRQFIEAIASCVAG